MEPMVSHLGSSVAVASLVVILLWWLEGWRNSGPNEIAVVEKKWDGKSLGSGQLVARSGERGPRCTPSRRAGSGCRG